MIELELLAPAKDLYTAIVAINSGADAVYIGGPRNGARERASNTVEDIAKLCKYAHQFRVKVYVTLNTIIYDDEISDIRQLVRNLYNIGVDALIVQDMCFLEMDIPPIPLHASTQCDTRTVAKAQFLEKVGFSQIVLPREMTLEEIRQVRKNTSVPLEAFVHGALCVSYSGNCYASYIIGGRSANRGECAQPCRLPYNLVDGNGKTVLEHSHLLSLKDLNRINYLGELIEAGISSFKIEGRLKTAEYVANVTAEYSKALNRFIKQNPQSYCRASKGKTHLPFESNLNSVFNRGYTPYFLLNQQPPNEGVANLRTSKYIGQPVATVTNANSKTISIKTMKGVNINNGDGLVFFSPTNRLVGLRVNRINGNQVIASEKMTVLPTKGSILYRNRDNAALAELKSGLKRMIRTIEIEFTLKGHKDGISLTVTDERNCRVSVFKNCEVLEAKKTQKEHRRSILEKTGNTIYRVKELHDQISDNIFIRASILTELRRDALSALDEAAAATRSIEIRKPIRNEGAVFPLHKTDMYENIANKHALTFYTKHNVEVTQPAVETLTETQLPASVRIMTSRYCIRRELGMCLKQPEGRKIAEPLTIFSCDGSTPPMQLSFDCVACRMHVYITKSKGKTN